MIADLIAYLQVNGLFTPSLIVLSAGAAILLYRKFGEGDDYEREMLEEIVLGDVKDIVEEFGSDLNKKLSYGINEIGKIEKAYSFDQEIVEDPGEDESEGIDQDPDTKTVPHYFLKVRDTGMFNYASYLIVDEGLGFQKYHEYLAPPEEYVRDEDIIKIDDDWHPMKMGGIWVTHGEVGKEIVQERTFKAITGSVLETAKQTVDQTSYMNLQFVQNMKEMERLKEMRSGNLKQQLEDFMEGE